MAFPKTKMPPPGHKPALVIAVGPAGKDDKPPKDAMTPPDDAANPDDPDNDKDEDKISPDKALVSHGDEQCSNCSNYHAEDGSCEKVQGQFSPDDRCWSMYSAMGDESGDADGDAGAMPPMPSGAPAGGPPQ